MDELTEVREALQTGEVSQAALAEQAAKSGSGRRVSRRSLGNLLKPDWSGTVRVVRAAHEALMAIRAERAREAAKSA